MDAGRNSGLYGIVYAVSPKTRLEKDVRHSDNAYRDVSQIHLSISGRI